LLPERLPPSCFLLPGALDHPNDYRRESYWSNSGPRQNW
jgi:hypothetical protein